MSKIDYPADGGGPAHPVIALEMTGHGDRLEAIGQRIDGPGMSLRTYAAIHLGVPESGIGWLDQMIATKIRRDLAGRFLQGRLAYGGLASSLDEHEEAEQAYKIANAFLAEQEEDHE